MASTLFKDAEGWILLSLLFKDPCVSLFCNIAWNQHAALMYSNPVKSLPKSLCIRAVSLQTPGTVIVLLWPPPTLPLARWPAHATSSTDRSAFQSLHRLILSSSNVIMTIWLFVHWKEIFLVSFNCFGLFHWHAKKGQYQKQSWCPPQHERPLTAGHSSTVATLIKSAHTQNQHASEGPGATERWTIESYVSYRISTDISGGASDIPSAGTQLWGRGLFDFLE